VKLITAGISVATAIVIWPLIPRLVALPSPARYASANRRLQKAMDALEQSNAELESRVTARTAELEEATLQLETRRQEAERAAEERTVMLREMHHRTGNNLQVISSFVGLTLRGVKDPGAANAIREIRARLAAITDVNRLLLRSDTFASGRADEYLQRLTEDLKETSLPPGAQITISVDLAPVEMSADKLTYLGLVAVELITNSVKYAFPEGRIGNVAVRLSETPGGLIFEVADDGKGYDLSAASQGPGAGVTIVRQFASRLNALVEQYSAPGEGTRVRLNFKPEGGGLNGAAPA
jgi:two-component sensor histidine kinase